MSILDDALGRFGYSKQTPPIETKAASGSYSGALGTSYTNPFNTFNNKKAQLASYEDWVYIAARTVAEECATIDLRAFLNRTNIKSSTLGEKLVNPKSKQYIQKLMERKVYNVFEKNTKGEIVHRKEAPALEELETNPLLDLLAAPNPFMTKNEFLEITFLHLELTGNAYWAILERGKGNVPTMMFPLMPNQMAIVPDANKFITGYVYTVNGAQIPFEVDDIIHHKYANPTDMREGYSAVQGGARVIDTDTHMAEWNRKTMYNDARISGFITTDSTLDEKVFKRIKNEFNDSYGGTANAYKVALLEGGMDFKQMSLTPKDMDFSHAREFNRDQILALFGVPKSLIGLDASMSRANAEAAEYGFSRYRIKPKMQRMANRITEDLAVQFDKKLVISFTDPVPENKEYLLEESQAALGMGGSIPWMTPNEERAKRGDPNVEGGDELLVPSSFVTLGQLINPLEAQAAADGAQGTDSTKPSGSNGDSTDTGDDSSSSDSGSGNSSDSNASSADNSGSTGSESTSDSGSSPVKAYAKLAASEIPGLYDDLDIDFDTLGCIMINTQTIPVLKYVPNGENDLVVDTERGGHTMGAVAESKAHVTLLFGLLQNGNIWKDKVDAVLNGWKLDSVTIESVGAFDVGDAYAVVAHIVETPELIDGHERLTLLPHINTFSEYKPHLTLAYVAHDKEVCDKWVNCLSGKYAGTVLQTTGINYGELPDSDTKTVKHIADEHDMETKCKCCAGKGEHLDTMFECYRCDASGLEADAVGAIPCDGRADSPNIVLNDDGSYEHAKGWSNIPSFPKSTLISEAANAPVLKASVVADEPTINSTATDETPLLEEEAKSAVETYVLRRDRIATIFELAFMHASRQRFLEQKEEVLAALHMGYNGKQFSELNKRELKIGLGSLFDKTASVNAWVASMLPLYERAGHDGVKAANDLMDVLAPKAPATKAAGTPGGTSYMDELLHKYFKDRAGTISVGIDEETDKQLRASLTEGVTGGEDRQELLDRVEKIYGSATGYRADRIGRTESQAALNYAAERTWDATGLVAEYIWLAAADPCALCQQSVDQVVTKSSEFATGPPPVHPNCRCTLTPYSFKDGTVIPGLRDDVNPDVPESE
jgi:HK97 family phage portal protein